MAVRVPPPKVSAPRPKISRPTVKPVSTAPKVKVKSSPRPLPGKGNRQNHIRTAPKDMNSLRRSAVRDAWKQERQLVKLGSSTRPWTPRQTQKIVKTGKAKGYVGHHVRSVSTHSKKWARDPRNIKFVTHSKHLKGEHRGNYKNPSTGKLIDRGKMIRMAKNNRVTPNKPSTKKA